MGHPAAATPTRFLIVRVAAIGDVAMSTTLLGHIRAEHKNAHVTWLCGSGVRDLVALFPGVDEVIVVDERRLLAGGAISAVAEVLGVWRRLLGKRFDRVLHLHADARYRLLTLPLFGARVDAASHGPGPETNPVRGRYRGDEIARLLSGTTNGPIGTRYPLADVRDRLPRGSAPRAKRVALVPGGTRNVLRHDSRRRWPVASYKKLAEELVSRGFEPVLIGDKHDADVEASFGGVRVTSLIGKTTLTETLGVLRDVDLLITHDTGPMHLARLVRTPMVALFGPTDPREFVGEDDQVTVVWGGAELACRPCYDGRGYPPCSDHVCMSGIAVKDVLEAVLKRLK